MGFQTELDDRLESFIAEQELYFVATSPLEGRVNLSPKGIDSFRIFGRQTVAYLDLTGSGNETAAHLLENPRLTIMFCSFGKSPLILRLYGTARSIKPADSEWEELYSRFVPHPSARQIFVLDFDSVQTSCGFGVPMYDFVGERDTMQTWAEKKGPEGVRTYWKERNVESIDGKPTGIVVDK